MKTNKYILTLALTICCALGNLYAITSSYYSSIDGKKETNLRDALYTITSAGPQNMSYDKLWTAYKTTDVYPSDSVGKAGKIWDMYSNVLFTVGTNQCGSYSNVGDCYNREHSLPKSWFNEATPAYYDLGHIVPTDGYVNNQRSNYAFGECASGTRLTNGTKKGLGKLGTSTFSGYTNMGKVFEPDDIYKGDFARMYMYMVVRYKKGNSNNVNLAADSDGQKMFNSTDANYGLTDYSIALLMKWHRQDPVSQKEINRNNGMQTVQNNRNPFIDYPCLAEYLWGNKAGETVTLSELVGTFSGSWTTGDGCPCGNVPAITLPSGDIDCGSTEANVAISKTVTVQGVNLTSGLTFTISGTNAGLFTLSASSMTQANATTGSALTITYKPTSAGTHSATLTISGGGLSSSRTFNLSGTCCNPYMVTLSRNGLTETIGACGTYTLPTADDEDDPCDGWEFQGWLASTTSFTEGTTTAPTAWVTSVTSSKTLHAVYGKTTTTGGGSPSTATYTFKSKSWTATEGNWTSGKDGAGYSNSGVQVTAGASGANATCPNSYNTITGITVSYCTNSSSGAGSITMGVGSTELTQTVTKTGGTTARDLEFDFSSTKPSGSPKITVSCSTNSIYVCGVTITYGGGGTTTTTYKKEPCTTYTISYVDADGIAAGGTYWADVTSALSGTTITLDYEPATNYEFTSWTVTNTSTSQTIAVTNSQFTMPAAKVTVQANFTALCTGTLATPNVTATPGDGRITLTWPDVTDANSYEVHISTGVGYTTECAAMPSIGDITHSGTTNTCEITGLVNGLSYTTTVMAHSTTVCDGEADEDTTIPTAEIPTEVTVTFNANGGEGTMSDQTIPYNTATALDANAFTRTGYTFQGWATEQGGAKVYNDGASVTLTEDITLYAVWQINSHNVTFTQPTSGGTFTVNGSDSSPVTNVDFESTVTIVVTPTNSHFTVNTVTVTGASGAVTVLGEGNTRTFTMPDEDVTVAVTMTEDPKYTVNWYVSGTPTAETKYAGETLAGIGTPSIECNDKVFQGWTSHNDYDSDDAPDDLFTDASTKSMPSNNNTSYYAVFATVEGETTSGTASWTETAITALTSTDVFVIVGDDYALPNDATSASPKVASVTISQGEITSTISNELKWNISGNSTDGYTFYPNGSTTTWLYCNTTADSKNNDNIRVGTGDRKAWKINNDGYLITKDNYVDRYLSIYTTNGSAVDFRGYINTTNGAFEAKYYKYTEGSGSTTTTISGYTTSCVAPEYYDVNFTPTMTGATITVNGQSASPQSVESGATVSIAISPDAAHTVSGVSVTGGVTPSGSGNDWSFTMPAGDVTVTVTLADVPAHTVTWSANGVTTTEQYYEGQAIAFPVTATGCDGKEFTGWSAETVAETDIAPSYVTEATMGTSDLTYYAVFAQYEPDKWDRITTADDFISGNYLIVSEEAGDALKNAVLTKDYWIATETVTITDHSITTSDANIIWNVTKSSSNYTFYNEAVSKYLAIVTSGSYKNLNLSDSPCDFTASFSDNAVILSANSRQITRHASYAEYLAGESQTDNKVYLYKQRISGYTTTCETCENKVTITKGTAANGSFSLNKTGELSNCSSGGLVVTVSNITPAVGYEFGAITQTGIASGVTIDQSAKTVTYAQNVTGTSTINVVFVALPTYTIRFIDNGAVISTQEVFDGQSAVKPSQDPTPCEGYAFAGWWDAPLTTPTTTAETWITDFTASANQDYYAVYSYSEESEGAPRKAKMEDEVTDVLTRETTGVTNGSTTYSSWSGKTSNSNAVYAGQSAGGNDAIQLRSNNNNSGIVTTASGGKATKVVVEWQESTVDDRTLSVYGKNSAYSAPTDLYGENAGTSLGTIVKGTSTELTITGDYEYIGLRSASGALYLTSVSITWSTGSGGGGSSTTYYTTAPDCEPEVTPTDMMIVAEYGGARIALTHNDEYTSFGATPMMFVGGKYYYPNSESAATPVIADMTWQVTEMDGEGYIIKAGEQYLAPNEGAITLSDKSYPWPIDEEGTICYDAKEQTFVVGGEGSLLPKIHVVPVPKADDIRLTSLHSDRTLTPKRFGTLCLPHAVALPFAWGVRVYSVSGAMRDDDSGNLKGIYLEEEIEMLEAGKPYLIEPVDEKDTSTMQMWYAEGMDYVTEPVDAIAMVGNLSTEPMTVPYGSYVLSQNKLRKVAIIDNQTIGQYKAYFNLNDLEDPAASPQAHAYRVMYVEGGEQVVTDLSQTPGGINWNEPVYNILGMRVDRNATGVLIQGGVKFIIRVP